MVHHNGYWCTKCTERRIYTQDEATPKPTQMRPACGGKGEGRKGEKEKREKEERAEGSILPRAEDGGADADDGGAVADG